MTSLYATIAPHFTQDLLSPGLQIGYFDDGGVWQFLAPSLALRLPLRAIEWKNLVGVTQTIDRLPLHFVSEPVVDSTGGGTSVPLVCVYVIKCEDMERYKATVKAQIAQWIDRMNAARVDWMLLYVPLGTRAKRGSVSGVGMGGGSGGTTAGARHTASSGVYKKIFERIKTDFGNKKNASVSGGSGVVGGAGGGGSSAPGGGSCADPSRSSGVSISGLSNLGSSLGSSLAGSISGGGGANGVSVDRICKIDTLEGASVVGSQATNETQWTELLLKMRKCIMEAFECKCLQYEEEVRVLDAKRSLPNWDFSTFFTSKERLALMYQQTCLLDDAIRHLDELEAIFQFLIENDKRFQSIATSTRSSLASTDPIFTVSPLSIDLDAMHNAITSGQSSPLIMRLYFFSRQIRTLYLMGDFRQLIQRSTDFISAFHSLLIQEQERAHSDLKWFQPHVWAAGACLEIAYACELSWSGHDYQISSASIPEGVSFALTPEVMAGLLGDILYLARRVLKKSARSNGWWAMAPSDGTMSNNDIKVSSSEVTTASPLPWYSSLQSMFDASTPERFQRCAWELSHLASLHFSRAGRHRFAVFLGAECARYHFRNHEFESASRLFRSHARQCEEDKWWRLVSDSVKRICDSELALGRSAQAVAACFSMLEIAQASKAEVSRDYLDQLLTSLVQSLDHTEQASVGSDHSEENNSIVLRVKMGELIKPSLSIETMQSPESDLDYGDVRVTLSLTNQFPAGIHIESVRIRFARRKDRDEGESGEDTSMLRDVGLAEDEDQATSQDDIVAEPGSLVELQEHNVYLYERASVNLIFLYGDVDVGSYVCTGLECTVTGNSLPLFSSGELNSIRFEIPPRESTLKLHIDGPPLLVPASMEEIHILIDTVDDVIRHGVLEIALPDTCDIASISHALLEASIPTERSNDDSSDKSLVKKYSVEIGELAAKTRVTCSVWLVVGDEIVTSTGDDAPLQPTLTLAASLRYDTGANELERHTELRRSERGFPVAQPLVERVRLKRVDATRVFAAVALTCNAECGLQIRDYVLDITASTTTDSSAMMNPPTMASSRALRVIQDPNGHLREHRLLANESFHMVFGLDLSSEGDAHLDKTTLRISAEFDTPSERELGWSYHKWRTTSLIDIPLHNIQGTVYQIDVKLKMPASASASSPCATVYSGGEDVVFVVTVRQLDAATPAPAEPLLLCLDAGSDGDWILLGKQRETCSPGARFSTSKRLLPLRTGRVPFPQFSLRVGAVAVPRARVFCAQRAQALLVV